MLKRLLTTTALNLLLVVSANAQVREPARITTIPSVTPQIFNILDHNGNWLILGDSATTLPGLSANIGGTGVPGLDGSNGNNVNWYISQTVNTVAADTYAVLRLDKRVNYSGGVLGDIYSVLVVNDWVNNAGSVGYQTGITDVMYNSSTATGTTSNPGIVAAENGAEFIEGACMVPKCSPTWGSNIIGQDNSGQSDPPNGLTGLELDIYANGTDVNFKRNALVIVADEPYNQGNGIRPHIGYGIVMGSGFSSTGTGGIYHAGILLGGNLDYAGLFINPETDVITTQFGIIVSGPYANSAYLDSSTGPVGLQLQGTHTIADMTINTTSPNGIAVGGTHSFSGMEEESTAPFGLIFNGTYSTSAIQVNAGGSVIFAISASPGAASKYVCADGNNHWFSQAAAC